MRSPLLSLLGWREDIDTFCLASPPEGRPVYESPAVVCYYDPPLTLWQSMATWLRGKSSQSLELSKRMHILTFKWEEHDGYEVSKFDLILIPEGTADSLCRV